MITGLRKPIKCQALPEYPTYVQAKAFADDFRAGAENAYEKGDRYARYWLSSSLDIETTQLKENIYTAVAFPPAGFELASSKERENLERFRGWIFKYDPATSFWFLLVASQKVGIDNFIRIRREYEVG
jgi:hypothetical protein